MDKSRVSSELRDLDQINQFRLKYQAAKTKIDIQLRQTVNLTLEQAAKGINILEESVKTLKGPRWYRAFRFNS